MWKVEVYDDKGKLLTSMSTLFKSTADEVMLDYIANGYQAKVVKV